MAGEIDREMSSEQTLARWNANGLLELRGVAEPRRERDEVGFLAAASKHTRERNGEKRKDRKITQKREEGSFGVHPRCALQQRDRCVLHLQIAVRYKAPKS